MPFSGTDYIALAAQADREAMRAPSPEIRLHWEELAKEYRKMAVFIAERQLNAEPKNPS
jgi:hypothetical protein